MNPDFASAVSHHMHHLLPRDSSFHSSPLASTPSTPQRTWLELRDLSLVVSAHSDHTVCRGTKAETHMKDHSDFQLVRWLGLRCTERRFFATTKKKYQSVNIVKLRIH